MANNKFEAIKVNLASPERILEWSHGEVTKPETINYRSQKPERDGLFCERIFGPTKDWECYCGKYKKVRYKGVVCDRCGVEITKSSVRRERMGHISLASPVAHIWYLKGIPSRMGLVLNISPKTLEEIVYFVTWVVTDPGNTDLQYKQAMSEMEVRNYQALYGVDSFKAATGAEAVRTLLEQTDILKEKEEEIQKLKFVLIEPQSDFSLIISYLLNQGFENDAGQYVFERHYYPLLRFVPSEEKKAYDKDDFEYGPYPIRYGDKMLLEFVQRKLNLLSNLSNNTKIDLSEKESELKALKNKLRRSIDER